MSHNDTRHSVLHYVTQAPVPGPSQNAIGFVVPVRPRAADNASRPPVHGVQLGQPQGQDVSTGNNNYHTPALLVQQRSIGYQFYKTHALTP